jgi:hypothetical protein
VFSALGLTPLPKFEGVIYGEDEEDVVVVVVCVVIDFFSWSQWWYKRSQQAEIEHLLLGESP